MGVTLIGLLEWAASSSDVAAALEQVVPAPLVPLVPVALGGLALVLGVHALPNGPDPRAVSAPADTVAETATEPEPEPAAVGAAVSVASPPATLVAPETAAPAPFWAGIPAGAPTTSTSIVQVPTVPAVSYQ